jgi:hypothetical protein
MARKLTVKELESRLADLPNQFTVEEFSKSWELRISYYKAAQHIKEAIKELEK